jgi:hypothetical protein
MLFAADQNPGCGNGVALSIRIRSAYMIDKHGIVFFRELPPYLPAPAGFRIHDGSDNARQGLDSSWREPRVHVSVDP